MILPKHVAKNAPKGRLLAETEWRGLGVQQSRGWVHYAVHRSAAAPRTPLGARAPLHRPRARPFLCNRTPSLARRLRSAPFLAIAPTPWLNIQTDVAHTLTSVPPSRTLRPEPHILLFRRPNGTDPTTGLVHGKRIDPGTGKVIG